MFIFNEQFWNQSKFKIKFITFLYHHCTNSHIECQCSLNPNQNAHCQKNNNGKSLLIDQVLLMITRSTTITFLQEQGYMRRWQQHGNVCILVTMFYFSFLWFLFHDHKLETAIESGESNIGNYLGIITFWRLTSSMNLGQMWTLTCSCPW